MVDANARYAAAAAEISARIQSRNNLALQFVTYASAIIGIATSKDDWRIIGASVGYIALGVVLLARSHTLFIAALVRFQQQLTNAEPKDANIPDWNADGPLKTTAAARRAADHSQMYFLVTAVAIASVVSLPKLNPLTWDAAFWAVGAMCGVIALLLFYQTGLKRDEIMQGTI